MGESVGAGGGRGEWDESQVVVLCPDSLVEAGSGGEVEGRRGQE